jgi:hypothetical protein
MKHFGVLFIPGLVLLVSCAASTSSPMHQASKPKPAPADPTQTLTPVVTTADDPRLMEANRYARELGYKIETHHGVQYYCRSTAPIGSRLTQRECLTVDTMVQTQKSNELNNARLSQQQACPKSGCPTS